MSDRTVLLCERAMSIAIGCTRRGSQGKHEVGNFLRGLGHEVEDLGCEGLSATFDYSDPARSLTSEQMGGRCDVAMLVDRDGAGMCIAANRLIA